MVVGDAPALVLRRFLLFVAPRGGGRRVGRGTRAGRAAAMRSLAARGVRRGSQRCTTRDAACGFLSVMD